MVCVVFVLNYEDNFLIVLPRVLATWGPLVLLCVNSFSMDVLVSSSPSVAVFSP